jgi:hypothetical protein
LINSDPLTSKETSLTNGSGGDLQLGQWSLQDSNTPSEMDHVVSDVQWSAVTTLEEEEQPLATHQAKTDQCKGVTVDQWKSCSICLEELADSELLVHQMVYYYLVVTIVLIGGHHHYHLLKMFLCCLK